MLSGITLHLYAQNSLHACFLSMLGKFTAIISSNKFSALLSLSSPSGPLYNANVNMLDVVPEVS